MTAIDVARRYIAARNARDAAQVAASFREGGTYEDPNTGGPIGTGPLGGYAAALWSAFPDLEFEEVEMRESGAREVTFAWLMRGTKQSSLRGLPPTGARIALPGGDLITVSDDGVERVRGYFDRATLMDQLGVQSWVRCAACGRLRAARKAEICGCGAAKEERPAFW